jgi:hypothetical protein
VPEDAPAAKTLPVALERREEAQPAVARAAATASAAQAKPVRRERRLRRLKHSELSTEMMLASAEIIRRHHGARVGTEIDVEVDEKPFVARIERHFHPVGGAVKPWGHHPGVSLFVER